MSFVFRFSVNKRKNLEELQKHWQCLGRYGPVKELYFIHMVEINAFRLLALTGLLGTGQ